MGLVTNEVHPKIWDILNALDLVELLRIPIFILTDLITTFLFNMSFSWIALIHYFTDIICSVQLSHFLNVGHY